MNHLLIDVAGHVATVTLNRPEVRNAFNDEVILEVTQAFTELGARGDVRCIVLAANGPAFCAGADLNWMRSMADYTRAQNLEDAGRLASMMRVVYECPKPTIAKVQGDVYAGGTGLVAACDMAVSVDTAGYCLSEVKLGLIPATISPYVVRAMGARAAHRYFLTAERFDAAEALRIGFIHELVKAEALDAKVAELAQALVNAGPEAVRLCKKLVQDVAGQPITPGLVKMTVEGIADIRVSAEGREGVQSFLQKRKPNWLPVKPPPCFGIKKTMTTLDTAQLIALAGALGWASGVRLYLVVLLTGLAGFMGWVPLPAGLQLLAHPVVLGVSGFMVFIEFFADKIPGLDSLWDVVHGVIRIPAGAALAAAVFGADNGLGALVAALLGGTLAATSFAAKATSRAAINTSPEPFSNIGASLLEDGLVPLGLWLAVVHPLVFVVLLAVVLALSVWLIRVCWRFLRQLFVRVARIFSGRPDPGTAAAFTLKSPFSKQNDHHV
jgi:methylglutaconyl-CoA hydratase